jgi:hypothetical protein
MKDCRRCVLFEDSSKMVPEKKGSVTIASLGFVALARAEFTRKGGTSENYAKTQTSQQNCPVIVSNNEFSPNTTKHIY